MGTRRHIRSFYDGNAPSLLPLVDREYGMPKAVQKKLHPDRNGNAQPSKGVGNSSLPRLLADLKRRYRRALLFGNNRRINPHPYIPLLFRVRYDLHTLFLPLPDLVYEEQVLWKL